MISSITTHLLGSELWTNSDDFEDEQRARINMFSSAFSQSALLARASYLRGGILCSLSINFSVGATHYVRKITFDDGVEWVARLHMPETYDATELESEVATGEFLRFNSNIPIPRVHYYDFGCNDVGVPYSLMDYVHGTTAEELCNKFSENHHSIPDRYFESFWRQVASIVVELASIRASRIGSVVKENGKFMIGKLCDTNTGPYKTTKDLYDEYPTQLSKTLFNGDPDYLGLPSSFDRARQEILRNVNSSKIQETFGLCNLGLGLQNLLIDHEFNILAMIGLHTIVAYPNALLHRLPLLGYCDGPLPWESNDFDPTDKAHIKRAHLYARFVAEAQAERVRFLHGEAILKQEGFFTREALAFSAFTWFKNGETWVINSWKEGLLELQQSEPQEILDLFDLTLTEDDLSDEDEPDRRVR